MRLDSYQGYLSPFREEIRHMLGLGMKPGKIAAELLRLGARSPWHDQLCDPRASIAGLIRAMTRQKRAKAKLFSFTPHSTWLETEAHR